LTSLQLLGNKFTSIDFLTTLPQPDKLKKLEVPNNQIQLTALDFLKPFVNLKSVSLGTTIKEERNLFSGSLKPLQNLTKLETLCIAGTDVDSGLEYLPPSLVKSVKKKNLAPLIADQMVLKLELRLFKINSAPLITV
jgi:hypothetical protein